MSRYSSPALRQQVRSQFGDRCAYCQTAEALTVSTFEIEHIMPLVAGGETDVGNLCLACPSCNRHKAARRTAIDPDTQQPVDLFHPQQQAWAEHFAWSDDGTEILGLTAIGRATIAALVMNRPQLLRVRRLWVKLGEHPP